MGSAWINIPIGIVIVAAVVGIPLWLVLRRRHAGLGRGVHTALVDSDQLGPGAATPDATPQSAPEITMNPPDEPRQG